MTRRSPPPALERYLRPAPAGSLILLTSTLGCSVSWLTTRFISACLGANENASREPASIVLVSWMRDLAFWKDELRRGAGLDIAKLPQFAYIDSLSHPARSLADTETLTTSTIAHLSQRASPSRKAPVLLILDNPDILLATGATSSTELSQSLLRLRSQVHATILTCSADQALVSAAAAAAATPMEAETAAFVTSQAHVARRVLSVRELETGAARDISGVLRITKGGGFYDDDDDEDDEEEGGRGGEEEEEKGEVEGGQEVDEAELLYLVQRDGNVKVFCRGTDAS